MRGTRLGLRAHVAGAVLAAGVALSGASAQTSDSGSVLGYGPLNFGMSIADALRAAPKPRLMRCDFPNHFRMCVDYDDKPYGLSATVRARFDADQKLDAIYVQFDMLSAEPGSQSCTKTGTAVLNSLREEFGPNWQKKPVDPLIAEAKGGIRAAARSPGKSPAAVKNVKDAKSAAPDEGATAADVAKGRGEPFLWFPAKGGKIGLVTLCSGDDTGVVYVVYTPSSIPGHRAS